MVALALMVLAQPGPVVPFVAVHPTKIALSGSARLTLAVEGPAPLRVELPSEADGLLAPEAAAVWRIRPIGLPKVAAVGEGRERWERAYRVDPFVPGKALALAFAPVKVTAGTDLNPQDVTWPAVEIEVFTTVADTGADAVRPVTGIEELPAPPVAPPDASGWGVLAGLGVVFVAVLAVALARKWRARRPTLPPGEWAGRTLAALARDSAAGRVGAGLVAERVAAVLREYVERRDGIAAPKLTTAELVAAGTSVGWPADATAALQAILEQCDRAKFAGDVPDAAAAGDLLGRACGWVTALAVPAAPR